MTNNVFPSPHPLVAHKLAMLRSVTTKPKKFRELVRELAILLAHFGKEKILSGSIHAKLLDALRAAQGDRQQQIHYFYCLRLLHDGWTAEQKANLLAWYESTRDWVGGHSFSLFLEHILRDLSPVFSAEDRSAVLARAAQMPLTATVLVRYAAAGQLPSAAALAELYLRVLETRPSQPRLDELRSVIVEALSRGSGDSAAALRKIADRDPSQRDAVARAIARTPSPENFPYLVRGLESGNPVVLFDSIDGLKKIPTRPKPEDGAPFRALLLAANRLDARNRWRAVELLRHWTGNKQFGAEPGDWKTELAAWSKWFAQTFPREPALPNLVADKPAESRYKFDELLAFLEKDPAGKKGDPARGRLAFEKGQCIKCHKFGKEGEGIGPDLTTLSKRFKRIDTLESLFFPSKVISDQYRSTTIETRNGQRINGLMAPQGDMVTILQSDGSKITLKKAEIEQQFASLVSVMPEKLLDQLTKQEIADLFAFLESEPK